MNSNEGGDKTEQLFDLASECRLLSDLTASELRTLSRYCQLRTVTTDTTLFDQGDQCPGLWFLIRGRLGIYKEAGEAASFRKITTVRPGQALGEVSLMDAQPSSAKAVALEECTLLLLANDRFESLLKETPGLGITLLRKIGQQLSRRLRQTTGMLVDHLD